MKDLTRKAVRKGGPLLFRAAAFLLRKKSPEKTERAGERLAALWWSLGKKRRERAIANLGLAFPDWTLEKRTETAREVFNHFARITADFLSGTTHSLETLEASTEIEGWNYLEEGYAKGKGVMFITGHFGNWERVSALLSLRGQKITVVARDADQADVNDMVNALREGPGTRVVARGNAARPVMERLRANEGVGILPDQNAKETFIPFFGHPAGTVLGPGVLAERTGCAVIPVACTRIGVGRYRIKFYPPLPVEPTPGAVKGERTMLLIHAWLEEVISEKPEQWLWIHDRWRSARKRGLLPE
jgi:Kdo2-lipid IVA lauroyltransferase/acyltransferase